MYNRYLITGATGFLGRAIIEELVHRNVRVDALVLHNDPYAALLPGEVTVLTFSPSMLYTFTLGISVRLLIYSLLIALL